MAEPVVALRDVRVQNGAATVLDLASFAVGDGEVVAMIGPNGAGKSTLLRVIGLLQPPTSGEVYFRGDRATPHNSFALRRRMASALQAPLLLDASVYANAALGLRLRGLPRQEIDSRLRPWLERLGIAQLAERRVRTLSGGEARRTCLVRALVLDPELLLLDEPFSALDAPSREALLLDLQQILGQTGAAVILVTHDLHEAAALAHRIGVLNRGKLLQLGPAEDIFIHPATEEVAVSAGMVNRIAAVATRLSPGAAIAQFRGGRVPVHGDFPSGARLALRIRPEDVEVQPDPFSGAAGVVSVGARIRRISPGTSQYRVVIEAESVRSSLWSPSHAAQRCNCARGKV